MSETTKGLPCSRGIGGMYIINVTKTTSREIQF